ncbi:hypothetical protein QQP08_024873 [Theobroma cacao]|nr:hypothetical protein QQP08_024873 [Theobroma cacao]
MAGIWKHQTYLLESNFMKAERTFDNATSQAQDLRSLYLSDVSFSEGIDIREVNSVCLGDCLKPHGRRTRS